MSVPGRRQAGQPPRVPGKSPAGDQSLRRGGWGRYRQCAAPERGAGGFPEDPLRDLYIVINCISHDRLSLSKLQYTIVNCIKLQSTITQ